MGGRLVNYSLPPPSLFPSSPSSPPSSAFESASKRTRVGIWGRFGTRWVEACQLKSHPHLERVLVNEISLRVESPLRPDLRDGEVSVLRGFRGLIDHRNGTWIKVSAEMRNYTLAAAPTDPSSGPYSERFLKPWTTRAGSPVSSEF